MLMFFIIKVFAICVLLIAIRGTLPRYRMDMLSTKAWKEWVLIWVGFLVINTGFLIILF